MKGAVPRLAAIASLAWALCGCASHFAAAPAFGFRAAIDPATAPPVASAMPASYAMAEPPPGFISFCTRFPAQCAAQPGAPAVVSMTPALWQQMAGINEQVNDSIWPEDDKDHYGRVEYWTIPTDGYGDCDDYAVTKRKELADAGFPQPALRLAVAITPEGERHAVLTVATDHGDYVLDNLRAEILPWNQTGYLWIERQDPREATGWLNLQPGIAAQPDIMTAAAAQPAVP